MATSIEEILGRDINSVKELKQAIKELQDSIANADPTSEEFKDTVVKLTAAQEQLSSVTKASVKDNNAAKDSIVGMEKEYKNLYNTYKMMSEEQRNSQFGKDMAAQLNELSVKLNETKKEVGNFKDNIGHYSEGVMEAFNKMGISMGSLSKPFMAVVGAIQDGGKGLQDTMAKLIGSVEGIGKSLAAMGSPAKLATTALKSVGAAMKALIANPVGAAIMAIVVAFKALGAIVGKVKEAINKNEESQMKLKEAMSAFQPVVDGVANAFDKLGQIVVKVIGWFGDAFRKLREISGAVTDFLGITKGAQTRIKEQNDAYKELAKAQNQLTKTKREYQKLNAGDKAEVERLREEASETENVAEKKRLLEEAKAKQAEIDARNIEIAKEEARILQEQATHTANDAAANDALAAALANVANMEAAAAANARMFNKQIKAAGSSTSSAASATKNYREEAKKLNEQLIESNKTEFQKLTEKYEKEKKLLIKYHYDTKLLTKKYNEDIAKIIADEASQRSEEALAQFKKKTDLAKTVRELILEGLSGTDLIKATTDQAKYEYEKLEEYVGKIREGYKLSYTDINGNKVDKIFVSKFKAYEKPLKEYIDKVNEALDLDIKFPPAMTPEDIKLFDEQLELLVKNYKKNFETKVGESAIEYAEGLMDKMKNLNTKDLTKALESGWMNEGEFLKAQADNTNLFLRTQAEGYKLLLDGDKLTEEQRIEIWEKYFDAVAKLREADWELEKLDMERRISINESIIDSLGSVSDAMKNISTLNETMIEADLKSGKITEEQAKKKKKSLASLEKVIATVAITQIVASTAQGIAGVWNAYAQEKVTNAETAAAAGPAAAGVLAGLNAKSLASAIIQTAGLAANGAAQVASVLSGTISKVNSLQGDSGSNSTPTVASPAAIDTSPYTYTRQLQTAEEEDALNRPYFVSVVDIENGLNKVRVRDEESQW